MCRPTGIVTIVVLLNLFQLHVTEATIKSLSQEYSYPAQQINYNDYSLKEGIFVYAVCDKDNLLTEKKCTIIQRQFPYDEVTRSCNITLRVKHAENENMTEKIWVHAFGDTNAIILWAEKGRLPKLNLMAIHLPSCKRKVLELDDPDQSNYWEQITTHKILTYDNEYDIFFKDINSISESTGAQVGMRVGFDNKPQTIRDVMKNENGNYVQFISPIATRSPNKGYVYLAIGKNGQNIVAVVKPDGTEKILMSRERIGISTSANSDLITSCVKSAVNAQIKCTQFNENGEVKFHASLDLEDEKDTEMITVHTTPRGGFVILTGTIQYDEVDYSFSNHNVLRVDNDGRKLGGVRLDGLVNDHSARHYSVWENGDDYCVTSVGLIRQRDYIDIAVECFSGEDLSV